MTVRRLSQALAIALAALAFWILASRPDIVDPDFVIEGYIAILTMVAVAFGAIFLAVRTATKGSAIYWRPRDASQIGPIAWMILTVIGVMQGASVIAHWSNVSGPGVAMSTYLLVGALVPAAFLQFGIVKWPERVGAANRLTFVVVSGLALCLAAAWSYAAYHMAPSKPALLPAPDLLIGAGALLIGASFEEVLFRVLLLTALVHRTESAFLAVFLSSVVFALMHVPGALLDPVLHSDWRLLGQVIFHYAPVFLMQTFIGLFLGVLWLRSGSITVIALTHAILNLGKTAAYGLLHYGL